MITIWGRANSVNVQKVLWCCDELVLPYERIDAGLQFGRNNEPDYLAMNPTGKIPTLVDDDFVLWESNSILRYLVLQYGESSLLYPSEPRLRSSIDRWLDWSLTTLQPTEKPVFWLSCVHPPPSATPPGSPPTLPRSRCSGACWTIICKAVSSLKASSSHSPIS